MTTRSNDSSSSLLADSAGPDSVPAVSSVLDMLRKAVSEAEQKASQKDENIVTCLSRDDAEYYAAYTIARMLRLSPASGLGAILLAFAANVIDMQYAGSEAGHTAERTIDCATRMAMHLEDHGVDVRGVQFSGEPKKTTGIPSSRLPRTMN